MCQFDLFPGLPKDIGDREGKDCIKCGEYLPLDAFSLASGGKYRRSECRSCAQELARVRNELRSTVEPPKEGHRCPICQRNAGEVNGAGGKAHTTPWVLDHDHGSEVARGWLCHTCNRALGAFADKPERLSRAISYLHFYSEGQNVETENHLQKL